MKLRRVVNYGFLNRGLRCNPKAVRVGFFGEKTHLCHFQFITDLHLNLYKLSPFSNSDWPHSLQPEYGLYWKYFCSESLQLLHGHRFVRRKKRKRLVPPKRLCQPTELHGINSPKNALWTVPTAIACNLLRLNSFSTTKFALQFLIICNTKNWTILE